MGAVDALALGHLVVGLPKVVVARVVLDIDHVVIAPFLQAQAEFFDALGNHAGPADEGGAGDALVNHHLGGAQHALFFAFGEGDTFFGRFFRGHDDGFHHRARGIHKGFELLAVGGHVGNRALGHAAFGRRLRHGRCHDEHQARVKRFGNQVFGAKAQGVANVGGGHFFALLGLGQIGNGVNGGHFHLFGDGGGTAVQRAPEDEGEDSTLLT